MCVRYRQDDGNGRRFKTVELIVEELGAAPSRPSDRIVGLRVERYETELQRKVKRAGGTWKPKRRAWEIRYDRVVEIGLEGRIIGDGDP